MTGLQIAAAPVHLVLDAGKASWQCVSGLEQCLQQGKERFVETGSGIGTGIASVTLNDLQPIYGQSIRGTQTGLVALQTADGMTTAFGAAKALNVVGKGSRYFISEVLSSPPSGSRAAQRGAIGGDASLIKSMITSQKFAPDLMVKGVHFNVGKVELRALPDNQGGIVFKPVFSSTNSKDVEYAIRQANQALNNEAFRNFLIKHAEAGMNMAYQSNNAKVLEFKFLRDAVQRLNNASSKSN
ncbi:hypothetical protein EGK75_13220 [Neisseria weixii]|uniref:hypothetical protein n=1 Tax=Neisseria weixii TaxID=1853276 RepID=UPI000F5066FC|nr:hypothetical protein [Neisseria weixii]RPD83411.1 hypothetical protein EGK75_13220 [Neisseria weixii]